MPGSSVLSSYSMTRMPSFERIQNQLNIEHKPKPIEAGICTATWPTKSGELQVEHLFCGMSRDNKGVFTI